VLFRFLNTRSAIFCTTCLWISLAESNILQAIPLARTLMSSNNYISPKEWRAATTNSQSQHLWEPQARACSCIFMWCYGLHSCCNKIYECSQERGFEIVSLFQSLFPPRSVEPNWTGKNRKWGFAHFQGRTRNAISDILLHSREKVRWDSLPFYSILPSLLFPRKANPR